MTHPSLEPGLLNPESSTATHRGEWTIRSWELRSYLQFFFQEGDTTVSLNGETKKISKDDVLLIPSGAKWVTWLFFFFSFAFLFLIGPVNLYLWVNCIYHFINFTHFYCLFSYIFARYSFDPQTANANWGGSFIYFLFTDLIKLHWK